MSYIKSNTITHGKIVNGAFIARDACGRKVRVVVTEERN